MSVFIGRTVFSLVTKLSYQHFDWLYVFLTCEENRIVILLANYMAAMLGKARKGYLAFMFEIKTCEPERRTALTDYLGQITKK